MDEETIRDAEVVEYTQDLMPEGRVICPLFNKVMIRKDEAPEKHGVIWIPPTVRADQPVLSGTVVACGPDARFTSPEDYVVFSQYAGSNIRVDGITYVVMKEEDVHVIIRSVLTDAKRRHKAKTAKQGLPGKDQETAAETVR
jgi:chaperonin GroES